MGAPIYTVTRVCARHTGIYGCPSVSSVCRWMAPAGAEGRLLSPGISAKDNATRAQGAQQHHRFDRQAQALHRTTRHNYGGLTTPPQSPTLPAARARANPESILISACAKPGKSVPAPVVSQSKSKANLSPGRHWRGG